jgi:cell division protein FtsI/penicillin-binding protein 2
MLHVRQARCVVFVCLATTICVVAQSRDARMQKAVSHAMAGQHGTAVVLDVRSNQVIASYRLEVAARRVAYPGSSIKPFTLLALLQSGKLDGQTALVCRRTLTIAGRKLDCTHPDVKEPLDPAAALAYSCNSYFTTVALRVTPPELRDAFVSDGFAFTTSLAPAEATGAVALAPSPAQEQLEAIGEWGVKVTPLELARAYRQLALLEAKHDAKLDPLFNGLTQSVAYGMAHAAQPDTAMKVAGKTGTAPTDEGKWTQAWFAGYAPAQNPEIVVVVFLEKGHGGAEAANVAREIFGEFAGTSNARTSATNTGVAR